MHRLIDWKEHSIFDLDVLDDVVMDILDDRQTYIDHIVAGTTKEYLTQLIQLIQFHVCAMPLVNEEMFFKGNTDIYHGDDEDVEALLISRVSTYYERIELISGWSIDEIIKIARSGEAETPLDEVQKAAELRLTNRLN